MRETGMSEGNTDLSVRSNRDQPWACSPRSRKTLDCFGSGRRYTVIDNAGDFEKITLSGDGNILAAAAGRVLCLFNTKTRDLTERYVFDSDIEQVAVNDDGQVLLVADAKTAIHLIDVAFSHRSHVLTNQTGVTAMAIDITCSRLAIADVEGDIDIIDTGDFSKLLTLECGFVADRLNTRSDGNLLLCFGKREIAVYSLLTAKRLARYGNDHHVEESFCLKDEYLITAAPGGFVVFEPATNETRFVPAASYNAYAATPDGSLLVTARNYEFVLWQVNRNMEARQLHTYVRNASDVKICGEGQSVYLCGDDATVECFSVSGERIATYSDFHVPIMAAAATHDDRTLVVADEVGTVTAYDLVSGEGKRYHQHTCCISKLCVEGSLVATGAHDGWARVLDLNSGSEVFGVNFPGTPVQAVTLDGDRFVVIGNRLGQVRLYDLDNHSLVREFHGNHFIVRSLSISPCRRYLMSTNEIGEVMIFDYESGELINQFEGSGISYSGCFDETGEFLYFGDSVGNIAKTRPESKRVSRRWPVHRTDVRSIRIQDGNLVSLGIADDAFILDTKSGKPILECPLDTKPYRRAAFVNAAGTRLVTGGQDGCLMFRDTANGSILAELRNLAHGFLWLTRDDENPADYGSCFWTDREEMVQVYNRVGDIETLLAPASREYREYISIHNHRTRTMARVGMTPAATDQDSEALLSARRNSVVDRDPAALLERLPG